ncbi:MAG: methylated-DNA--[protein]-cysteine S-methyltransferase [Frankiaceae bacterium]
MAQQHGFVLFDTAIGRCGLVWGERGITAVHLPEPDERATRARIRRLFPGAREGSPPAEVERARGAIVALLAGRRSDLSAIELDMERVPAFHRKVYEAARTIPPGQTLTYGAIAERIGSPGSARAVGQALGRNPFAIVVPCHRVVAAGGRTGGFSASGGVATKLRMLDIERTQGDGTLSLFDDHDGLCIDPDVALDHVRAADPQLAQVIDSVGPFEIELKRTSSVFGALAEAIVYQQLNGKAAATIYGRVQALFPASDGGLEPERILAASDEQLRGAGLSRAKALSMRDLAQKAVDGELPELAEVLEMDDDAIVERLVTVRGIGRWTAEMFLIFRLGRPDVLPVDDYGIRNGFAMAFDRADLPAPKEVVERGELWRPYRTVASWYLWRVVERAREPRPSGRTAASGTG